MEEAKSAVELEASNSADNDKDSNPVEKKLTEESNKAEKEPEAAESKAEDKETKSEVNDKICLSSDTVDEPKQSDVLTDESNKQKESVGLIDAEQIETPAESVAEQIETPAESVDTEKKNETGSSVIVESPASSKEKDQDEKRTESSNEGLNTDKGSENDQEENAKEKAVNEDVEMEVSPSKNISETYANQFEKFLLQSQGKEKTVEEPEKKNENEGISQSSLKRKIFDEIALEETSNSSWYKMSDNKEESMDVSEANLPPDENSNMSAPDNCSVVSSNIGDSCMSFQNVDECSNLSVPEDSSSVPVFSGHAPVFDESANMNAPSNGEFMFIQPDTPRSVDADAMSETTPVKRSRRGTLQIAAEDASEHGHDLTAADIFEYQWPPEQDAEYYILQEQISIYLDIKSFKRKYPDLFRRVCDKQEKDFLRNKGVVSETQSDLGLTALKSDEVHDLMSKDYPAKYKEFLKILHEREKQKMEEKLKEYDAPKLEKEKMIEYTKKAMKSASDWNRNLLRERREERQAYFDMQTFTIQYPKGKFRKLENVTTEVSAYPLSLIPGQFQDYCRKYTSEELKYFPLNTAIFDPPKKIDKMAAQQQQSEEDTESQEDEAPKAGSASDSGSEEDSSSSDSDSENEEDAKVENGKKKEKSTSREISEEKAAEPPVVKEEPAECRICKDESEKKGKQKQQKVVDEELIHCSECKSCGHPSCLDLTEEMVKIIKTYPWQCMECKTCVQCMDPFDEDKMLFCDKCDRGYHTFCVGLKSLPTGKWECMSCRGDLTPIKPLPKPTPKSRRGRKPKDNNGKQTPNKDGGKQTPNKDGGKQTPNKEAKETPKEKASTKETPKEKASTKETPKEKASTKETPKETK